MARHSETDVLIVGSGAAGSMMALELARHGIIARNIDRLPAPSSNSKAITVHARSLEMLEQIDPQLLRRFTQRGIHSPGYIIHYVDEQGRRSEARPGLDFTGLHSNYPYLLLHRQDETEQTLRDYLQRQYGMQTEWGVSCTEVRLSDNEVIARLEKTGGSVEYVHARYLIACDGTNSRIRRTLELAQEEAVGDYEGAVLQNLDIELLDFPDQDEWVHYCTGPGHFIMVAKLPGGFFRLLMSQPAAHADEEASPHDVFSDTLARHFDGIRFGKTVWHSRWQSREQLAHSYQRGNVFLVGDAAHSHSTAGGQGMNCCLQDSYNLAWKLAMVLKGEAKPVLLDSYELERKPIGAQVIQAASQIHELFMAGRDNDPTSFQQLHESGFTAELIGRVSGLDYHYRFHENEPDHLAENGPSDGLQAGDRAPDALLQNHDEQRVHALLRHTGFTLLVSAPAEPLSPELKSRTMQLVQQYPGLLHCHFLSPAPTPYALPGQIALHLIRPDGYLAFCSNGEHLTALESWLAEQLVEQPAAGR